MNDHLTGYVLGHTTQEQQRLINQSRFLGDLTAQFWCNAGLAPGMQVLDLGCGVGDTSFLAASLVGPHGFVTGIDQSEAAIATATQRAAAAGVRNVRFVQQDLGALPAQCKGHTLGNTLGAGSAVDALVGRLVLLHLRDPSAVLRQWAPQVRAGGLVAFQEIDVGGARSEPPCPLFNTTGARIEQTFNRLGIDLHIGLHLGRIFQGAGLPAPALSLATRVERGAQTGICHWMAEITRTLLPAMVQTGVATAADVDVGTLAERMQAQAVELDSTLVLVSLIGACVTL